MYSLRRCRSIVPDVNIDRQLSGRLEMLIQPNPNLHINLLALGQLMNLGGYDEFDLPPGPDHQTHFQPYPIGEKIHDRVSFFSATVVANLGFADLTSATGYFDRRSWQIQDASEATSWTLESFLVSPAEMAAVGMPTYIDTPIYEAEPEHQISEEIRLNSTGSSTLHWVAGLFYSKLNSAFVEQQNAPYIAELSQFLSPPMNNPTGLTFGINNLYQISQKAAFADASWQLVPTFKLEGGLRWFRYDTSAFNNEWGYFSPAGGAARQSARELLFGKWRDPTRRLCMAAEPQSYHVPLGLQGIPSRRREHDDTAHRLSAGRPGLVRSRHGMGLRGR